MDGWYCDTQPHGCKGGQISRTGHLMAKSEPREISAAIWTMETNDKLELPQRLNQTILFLVLAKLG